MKTRSKLLVCAGAIGVLIAGASLAERATGNLEVIQPDFGSTGPKPVPKLHQRCVCECGDTIVVMPNLNDCESYVGQECIIGDDQSHQLENCRIAWVYVLD